MAPESPNRAIRFRSIGAGSSGPYRRSTSRSSRPPTQHEASGAAALRAHQGGWMMIDEMTESPLLSIVVPTKNRHRYLGKLLKSLLEMSSREFEVVVHDNSDAGSKSMELCNSIRDPRLRYFFEPTVNWMTDNCERGVALARGSFVCMIGDDDGVMECIVDVARWMKTAGIGAAVCVVPTYLWPGVGSVLDGDQTRGILRLPRYSGAVHIVEQSAGLEAVLRAGGITIGRLPSVYQGVVSCDALEALRTLAGTCFPGPSPDMANAVGLCAVIDRFAVLDYPIVISGSCPGSGAAQGARHSHLGEIADRKFLPPDTAASWPAAVPFYFSGPT